MNPEHESDRRDTLENSTQYTDDELCKLGVCRIRGEGVNDPETYKINNGPIDPETDAKGDKIDIRTIPGHD